MRNGPYWRILKCTIRRSTCRPGPPRFRPPPTACRRGLRSGTCGLTRRGLSCSGRRRAGSASDARGRRLRRNRASRGRASRRSGDSDPARRSTHLPDGTQPAARRLRRANSPGLRGDCSSRQTAFHSGIAMLPHDRGNSGNEQPRTCVRGTGASRFYLNRLPLQSRGYGPRHVNGLNGHAEARACKSLPEACRAVVLLFARGGMRSPGRVGGRSWCGECTASSPGGCTNRGRRRLTRRTIFIWRT